MRRCRIIVLMRSRRSTEVPASRAPGFYRIAPRRAVSRGAGLIRSRATTSVRKAATNPHAVLHQNHFRCGMTRATLYSGDRCRVRIGAASPHIHIHVQVDSWRASARIWGFTSVHVHRLRRVAKVPSLPIVTATLLSIAPVLTMSGRFILVGPCSAPVV